MAYDISELKKLPAEEKLQIIDELWETIDIDEATGENTFDAEPEVAALLQERIEKYERGEGVFYSPDEARRILNQRLDDFRKTKND